MLLRKPYRFVVVVLFLTISALWTMVLPGLQFRQDQRGILNPGDSAVRRWQEVERIFMNGDEMLIIGISDTSDMLEPANLARQYGLITELGKVGGIHRVSGIPNVPYLVIQSDTAWAEPFYHFAGTDSAWFDHSRFLAYPDASIKFLSDDHKDACIYVFYPPEAGFAQKEEILFHARELTGRYFPVNPIVYSPSVLQEEQTNAMRRETWKLGLISGVVCIFLIWFTFRRWTTTLFPLLIIALTVVWSLGLMSVLGYAVTPVSLSIPGVLAVVSLSDIIHILSSIQEVPAHFPMEERVRMALRDMRRPVSFTSLTTFLGFFMLVFTGVPPVQQYGFIASAGVVFSWSFSLLLVPNMLVVLGRGLPPAQRNGAGWLYPVVRLVAGTRRPWLVTVLFASITAAAVWYASEVRLDSPMYEDISRKDDLGAMMRFFEDNFSGIRSVEWLVQPEDTSKKLTEPELMKQLGAAESFISLTFQTQDIYSPATEVKRIWRATRQGDPDFFVVPEDIWVLRKIRKEITRYYDTLGLASSLSRDHKVALITGRVHDYGSHAAGKMYRQVDSACHAGLFPGLRLTPTGMSYLIDQSATGMLDQLKYGLLAEILLVASVWFFQTGSIRISVMALIPNILPMVFLLGLLGILDIPLKFSTMSVFTVVFGISVDDSIHYLHRYRLESGKPNMSARGAAVRATLACGKPMILTTLTLVCGFGVMTLSSFQGTFLSGALTASCLFLAMVTDLWLHPALQVIASPKIIRKPT